MASSSKEIRLFEGAVQYHAGTPEGLYLPLSKVAVIGEYRSRSKYEPGEYYFVLVARGTVGVVYIPDNGPGELALRSELSNALNCSLDRTLGAGAERESIVLWPPELQGEGLFVDDRRENRGWVEKLLNRIIPPKWVQISDLVAKFASKS